MITYEQPIKVLWRVKVKHRNTLLVFVILGGIAFFVIAGGYAKAVVFEVQKWYLTGEASRQLVPWELSTPFGCTVDIDNQNLICDTVLFPQNVKGVKRVNGSIVVTGQTFTFPLEEVVYCDISKIRDCDHAFAELTSPCVAWTALDKRGSEGGDIYFAVDCWGFATKYSFDNLIGKAIPLMTRENA